MHISAAEIVDTTAPYELVSKMRGSFWCIAPLVARMGRAKVSMPGGCAIGTRPVDLLIMALERLGAKIEIDGGYVITSADNGLTGGEIVFPQGDGRRHPRRADGRLTRVGHQRDRERGARARDRRRRRLPHQDGAEDFRRRHLAHRCRGVPKLNGTRHSVLPDRIETGTYAMAVAMTGGDVLLEGARPELLQNALDVLAQAGAEVSATNEGIRIARNGAGLRPVAVTTEPFPGFPTDLQAQLMALMTRAKGTSHITETIFENRFMHVQELARLGARIHLDGQNATIEGVSRLKGAPVMATDLRALGIARDRGARRGGRDHGQPRLPSRPRLRAARGEARPLRRDRRTDQRLARFFHASVPPVVIRWTCGRVRAAQGLFAHEHLDAVPADQGRSRPDRRRGRGDSRYPAGVSDAGPPGSRSPTAARTSTRSPAAA